MDHVVARVHISKADMYGFELLVAHKLVCQVGLLRVKQQWLVLILRRGNHNFCVVLKQGISLGKKENTCSSWSLIF